MLTEKQRRAIAMEKATDILESYFPQIDHIAYPKCVHYSTKNKNGYGEYQPTVDGKKYHVLMHRASYAYFKGILKPDEKVCHTCDNPSCINPNHLFKGTHADNVQDKVSKNRQAKGRTHGRYIDGRASDNKQTSSYYANRSLSKIQVLAIKQLRQEGRTIKSISEELNINIQTIKDVSCGRTYKDIN